MKINNPGEIGGLNGSGVNGASSARGHAAAKPNSPAAQGDSVRISELSRELHAFDASSVNADDKDVVDSERVSEIRQAISEGRFKVNPEKVADNLIASVRELLVNQKP